MALTQNGLNERDWNLLLQRIADGKCTPFLGPGVCSGIIPLRRDLAQSWAHEHDYPLVDRTDIARVAQYMAVQYDPFYPKEAMQKQLQAATPPDFDSPDQPHAILADLNLPIYITTNYDDFMVQALKNRQKDPKRQICRWNGELQRSQPSVLETGYEPTPANPLVYHLHGYYESLESLVLTEDDYLDFLVNISSNEYKLPHQIQRAITGASLLFVGYNPTDWDFRVLFRGLVAATESSLRRISVTVQLPPVPKDTPAATKQKVQKYLNEYFDITDRRMRVYWGTVQSFLSELKQRWQGVHAPPAIESTDKKSAAIDLVHLFQNLTHSFAKEELRTLAFELRVPYENLPEAKDGFARELIVYLQHRRRLHELVEVCRRQRPHTDW